MSRVALDKPPMPQAGELPPINLPRLRQDQYTIAQHPAKIKVLMCGRRWGKTILGLVICILTMLQGGKVAWVAPAYRNAAELWTQLERILVPVAKAYGFRIMRSAKTIEWLATGGKITIYSADNNASAIRSANFDVVVVDEAAHMEESVWLEVIYPTLSDTDGEAFLISTPSGKNWFWREYQRGQQAMAKGGKWAEQIASWNAPTSANPSPNIQKRFKWAEQNLPRRVFQQEWLAMPQAEGGEVFLGVREACILKPQPAPNPDHYYVAGIDFGRVHDFTVISVFDVTLREEAFLDQRTGIDWHLQRSWITDTLSYWNVGYALGESNSVGKAVIEELQDADVSIYEIYTDYKKKRLLIEGLALGIEHNNRDDKGCLLLDDPDGMAQLESYTFKEMQGGKVRYSAPKGMFDDKVMGRAIGWYAVQQNLVEVSTWDEDWDG